MGTLEDRPIWKGLPVPWVSRWSAEIDKVPYQLGPIGVIYEDETLADRGQHSELWMRENIKGKGQGEPQFAEMSSRRQRKAMKLGLCQVCGDRIQPPVTFLMTPAHMITMKKDGGTINPPTCSSCLEGAHKYCPYLKLSGSKFIRVDSYDLIGVLGEVAVRLPDGQLFREARAAIHWDNNLLHFTVAKQLIIAFNDFTLIQEVD